MGYWENVADCESGFFTAVDEGTGVKTFGCYECFFAELVAVGVAEDDTGEGRTASQERRDVSIGFWVWSRGGEWNVPTGIMDDLLNYSTDVAIAFCKV